MFSAAASSTGAPGTASSTDSPPWIFLAENVIIDQNPALLQPLLQGAPGILGEQRGEHLVDALAGILVRYAIEPVNRFGRHHAVNRRRRHALYRL
jgi:hypothetical protein